MKKIFAFPGRFQPFGPHHFKAYQKITSIHGAENVFIVTSNSTGLQNPLTFLEKKAVIMQYGIPPNQIVCCKSPYKPDELTQRFNKDSDSLIVCCGEKDKDRVSTNGYYTKYMGQVYTKPFKSQGYLYIVPDQRLNHENQEVNGTYLRNILPNMNPTEFKNLVGWHNPEIHELFKRKFAQNQIQQVYDSIDLTENAITKTQLQRVEQYADRLFKEYGIDIEFQNLYAGTHFLQRLNDPRNINQITADELRNIFKKASQKYGHVLSKSSDKAEGVLKDMETDINMPFIIKLDRTNGELDFVPKTILRKKGFYTNSPVFSMETFKSELHESLGFNRHIMHPHEDDGLTFGEFYEMFLDCAKNNNVFATLKLDGINLQVTVKGGKVLASRNKSTAMNPMTREELKNKYKDNPPVQTAFLEGFDAMEKYIQTHLIGFDFENGQTFLNFEILHPLAQKNYKFSNSPTLAIHNVLKYDALGNLTLNANFTVKPAKIGNFDVISTPSLVLHPIKSQKLNDFIELFGIFIQRLSPWGLQKGSQIKDLPTDQLKHDFKVLCLSIGDAIIQNAFEDLSKIDQENVNAIKQKITRTINDFQNSNNEIRQAKFKANWKLWKELGGQINPKEGVVFQWKNGKTYKWTGSFSPLNQILGIFKYN